MGLCQWQNGADRNPGRIIRIFCFDFQSLTSNPINSFLIGFFIHRETPACQSVLFAQLNFPTNRQTMLTAKK